MYKADYLHSLLHVMNTTLPYIHVAESSES